MNEAEEAKICLNCTILPDCDDRSKECKFVQITVGETRAEKARRLYVSQRQTPISSEREKTNAYQRAYYARMKEIECQTG